MTPGADRRGGGGPYPDLVRLYLDDVGRYSLLTKTEEVTLSQAIEAGREARHLVESAGSGRTELAPAARIEAEELVRDGEQATAAFVRANLRLVVSVARKYQTTSSTLGDLIQDGNLGLIHAVEKFDWRLGFRFSTYATWWIRQAITRGLSNTSRTIRLPAHAANIAANAYRLRYELLEREGRVTTTSELARLLDVEEHYLAALLSSAGATRSLSESVGEDGDLELGDLLRDANAISPAQAAVDSSLPAELNAILATRLNDRECQVLRLRFGLDRGEPRTLQEVSIYFGLTRERVRQIEQAALSKLRQPAAAATARDLLDG
jgi:RNA polymerase sigma factor (sigma-70 family)